MVFEYQFTCFYVAREWRFVLFIIEFIHRTQTLFVHYTMPQTKIFNPSAWRRVMRISTTNTFLFRAFSFCKLLLWTNWNNAFITIFDRFTADNFPSISVSGPENQIFTQIERWSRDLIKREYLLAQKRIFRFLCVIELPVCKLTFYLLIDSLLIESGAPPPIWMEICFSALGK